MHTPAAEAFSFRFHTIKKKMFSLWPILCHVFAFLCILFAIFLLKIPSLPSIMPSSVPKCKKTVKYFVEKIQTL